MPYSKPSEVPGYVPAKHKKQWMEVFNSAHAKALKDGKDEKQAEQSAFRQANGVVKKQKSKKETESFHYHEHFLGADMFFRTKEEGKEISAANLKKIQNIHDVSTELGGCCGSMSIGGGGIYESARTLEAALPYNTSHDALRGHLHRALMEHHGASGWSSDGPYVHDVFPEHVVYSHKGQTYKAKYSVKHGSAGSDPEVKLHGEHKKVHTAYVDSADQEKESMRILTSAPSNWEEDYEPFQRLREGKSVSITLQDGEFIIKEGVAITMIAKEGQVSALPKPIDVKVIGAGWGSMAYYPKEVLQRDGPDVFKKGTQMFWNHATESQELERPEGDLNDLAAILTENARWEENGAKGPGLYAKAKVFSDYAQQVSEKGPHIGVSINAGIKCHEGEVEGKSGRIADKFIHAFSADFVTKAGAGGAPIVPVTESQRVQSGKEQDMTEQEIKALQDKNKALETQIAQLQEGQNRVLAVATVGSVLREAGIDFNQKVLERACASPVMKEGKLDQDWVKSVVSDFSEGQEGQVTGMGHVRESDPKLKEEHDKNMKETYKELGIPEAGLEYAMSVGR